MTDTNLDSLNYRNIDSLDYVKYASREAYDRIEWIFDNEEYSLVFYKNIWAPDFPDDIETFEEFDEWYFELVESANDGDLEAQKQLINSLDKYYAVEDDGVVYATAIRNAVNANGAGVSSSDGLRYTIYFEGDSLGDNIMGDGELVIITKLIAYYDKETDSITYF